MDLIDLAQDRDQQRALVNTIMNLGFHKMLGTSGIVAQLAASEEGLSSMNLGLETNIYINQDSASGFPLSHGTVMAARAGM